MENYTRIIGATSTNIAVPTVPQINQGNDQLTPYNTAKNNGYYFEMSKQIGKISEELTNLIIAKGLTPDDGVLTQVLDSVNTAGTTKWVSAEDYSIGDMAREVTGTKLYRSEINSNTGLDIAAIAYNAGTTYEIDDVAMDTNGDVYRSLTGSNIGNPLTDPVNWKLAWSLLGDLANIVDPASLVEVNERIIVDKYISPKTLADSDVAGYQLISTAIVGTANFVDFTNLTDFSSYKFIFENVRPLTTDTSLRMRISTDNGATFKSGASDYKWANLSITDTGVSNPEGDNADTAIVLSSRNSPFRMSGNTQYGWSGEILLTNPRSDIDRFRCKWSGGYLNSSGLYTYNSGSGSYDLDNNAVDSVRFLMSSGTFRGTLIKLYGIR